MTYAARDKNSLLNFLDENLVICALKIQIKMQFQFPGGELVIFTSIQRRALTSMSLSGALEGQPDR